MKRNYARAVELMALRHANKDALINIERNRRYTYAQLDRLSNRIANALRTSLELGAGDRIMLILENDNLSIMRLPLMFKHDAVVALTNFRDTAEEHRHQAEYIRPQAVFIEASMVEGYAAFLQGLGGKVIVMDSPSPDQLARFPGLYSFWELVDAAPDTSVPLELEEWTSPRLLRFTGGTTGRGKCAIYTLDNNMAGCESIFLHPDLGFDSSTRMLHVSPLSHGTSMFLLPAFWAGGTNVTLNALDLEVFRQVVEEEAITHSFLVPTVLYRLLELQVAKPRQLGSLKTIVYGAAPMSPARLSDLIENFGPVFAQAYAATEAPALVSVLQKSDHRIDTPEARARLASAGSITPGVEVTITNSEGMPLPPGEIGEIRIRSRAVIPGYLDNPEGTAAEFEDGTWRSGDLGYIDQGGYLFIVDRLKDMIISGGFNVYAVEVEAALATHPAVLNAAVVGVPHLDWGEAVHAEVQLRNQMACTAEELIAHVRGTIGGYKTPKTISFVDELPVTVVGKVLRRQVREKYWKAHDRRVN